MRTLALVLGLIVVFFLGAAAHRFYQHSQVVALKLQIEELDSKVKNRTVVEKLVIDHNAVQCLTP